MSFFDQFLVKSNDLSSKYSKRLYLSLVLLQSSFIHFKTIFFLFWEIRIYYKWNLTTYLIKGVTRRSFCPYKL